MTTVIQATPGLLVMTLPELSTDATSLREEYHLPLTLFELDVQAFNLYGLLPTFNVIEVLEI